MSETCPRIKSISWPIDVPMDVDATFLFKIQICMSRSGDVSVFQWNREWFFSTSKVWLLIQCDDEKKVSWHGSKIVYRFRGIRKWLLRWWKRSCWFSKKINVIFSSNWMFPYQGRSSQFLTSPRKFVSSISDWKINLPFSLGIITSFAFSLLE